MASLGDGLNHLLMEVSPDIHICGFCKQQYNNFELFLAHKQNGCQVPMTNVSGFIAGVTESIQSTFPVEEALQGCLSKVVKKTVKIQKTPAKKLKPGLAQKKQTCSVLGCTFKTQYGQKDMERHMFTHTGERPFECELCHKCFSRRDKLNLHIRSHTGEKPHKCKHCPYAAADSSSLKKHLRVHYNERPFKCQICSYASRNSSQLTVHLRSHTGDAPFQCGECGAKFKINSDLKRHARVHSGEKPYSCNLCDYRCAMKANLKSHERLRHGTYSCTECDFRCTAKAALRAHSRQHAPAHPLRCACCPYSCTSKGALKRHERVHSDERPFSCHHCPFASKQRANLLVHMRKSHSETLLGGRAKSGKGGRVEEEPSNAAGSRYRIRLEATQAYRCDLCDASFVREDSLRSHKRQHDSKQKLQSGESAQLRTRVGKKTEEVPRQVSLTLTDSLVSSYGSTQLKIIVAPSLGQEGTFIQPALDMPSSKAANVLLSKEGQNVILNPIIQSVSLLTPVQHVSQPADGDIKHQTVLLTHVSANEESSLLQPNVSSPVSMETQNYLPSTSESSHAFITTCSDLDSLHALIQQGGTEVTVVSEGHHAVSTAATIDSTLKPSTGAAHTPPHELPRRPCEVETADGSGLIVTDLDMEPTSALLEHELPLTIATQNHQTTIYQIPPNQIFLDSNIQTNNEDSQ